MTQSDAQLKDVTRGVLKVVRWLAKVAPLVAPLVEKVADALLRADAALSSNQSTDAVIARAFAGPQAPMSDTNMNMGEKLPDSPTGVATEPRAPKGIVLLDDNASGRVAEGQTAVPSARALPREAVHDEQTHKAQEEALTQIKNEFVDSTRRNQKSLENLHEQEAVAFRLVIASAVVSLGLIVVGAYVFFVRGALVVGAVAQFLGLISGSGAAMLRVLQNMLKRRGDKLESVMRERSAYHQAIQTILLMGPGPAREAELSKMVDRLRQGLPWKGRSVDAAKAPTSGTARVQGSDSD